jgi:DNA-binding NarL/FixJ family response regulator
MRRVVLVDSDVCGWFEIQQLVHDLPMIQVVGETRYVGEALHLAEALQPDRIIVPDRIEQESSLNLLRGMHARCTKSRSIILAAGLEVLGDINSLRELPLAGLLVWTNVPTATIQHCLSLAICGEFAVYSIAVATAMQSKPLSPGIINAHLTPRERRVLELIADGHSDRTIAEHASLSIRTVERLVSDLKVKLSATSRTDLCTRALRSGLLTGLDARK